MSAETLELKLHKIICELTNNEKPTYELVRKIICRLTGLTVEQFETKTRKREIVQARQVSMWYFVKCKHKGVFLNSLDSIGYAHLKMDHATALHAARKVENFLSINDEMLKPICISLNNELRNLNKHFVI